MRRNSTRTDRGGRARADVRAIEVDDLIKQLVARFPEFEGNYLSPHAAEATAQVVCETEVDGVRYLILRAPRPDGSAVMLSPRERQIVEMVATGQSNKIIANELNISSFTVSTHLRRVFAKLRVGSRAAMIARAYEIGIARPWQAYLPNIDRPAASSKGAKIRG